MNMAILATIGVAELVAQGLHWPTVSEDIKFDLLEFEQTNPKHTKQLSEIQALKFLKYTELLLTQDL
jgi:hypothetical protein